MPPFQWSPLHKLKENREISEKNATQEPLEWHWCTAEAPWLRCLKSRDYRLGPRGWPCTAEWFSGVKFQFQSQSGITNEISHLNYQSIFMSLQHEWYWKIKPFQISRCTINWSSVKCFSKISLTDKTPKKIIRKGRLVKEPAWNNFCHVYACNLFQK